MRNKTGSQLVRPAERSGRVTQCSSIRFRPAWGSGQATRFVRRAKRQKALSLRFLLLDDKSRAWISRKEQQRCASPGGRWMPPIA